MESTPSATEHENPEGEAPWAMQLVGHVERSSPPSHTAMCEAAATAVALLLTDERSRPGGPWAPFVERWTDGRIRKLARRARGVAWDRVQDLPGITVAHNGAEVRAFVPRPVDETPSAIAKLQLQGFDLDDPDRRLLVEPYPGGPVVASLTPRPPLSTGKAAAAAGHAAQLALLEMDAHRRLAWATTGFAVEIEVPDPERWTMLLEKAQVVVVDGGFTEVAPGTATALARWR